MIRPAVEFDRTWRRKRHLEAPDIIRMKPEEFKPVDKTVAAQSTEGGDLVKAWAESPLADGVVEIVRKVAEAGTG